jgi:hypothetical protein
MAKKIILSQRTNRHVVKKLNDSYNYVTSFGTWETIKIDNTGLNFPCGIAADASNNIYICDSKNSRIVKLDSNLVFVSTFDVSTVIGKPFAILFDSVSTNLYVVGIYNNYQVSIASIDTGLTTILKHSQDIYHGAKDKIYAISRGFNSNEFLIVIGNMILTTTEGVSFSTGSSADDVIIATVEDTIDNRVNYVLSHGDIGTYAIWRTLTETPTQITTTTFQTAHFPIWGTTPGVYTPGVPDTDLKVFKNNTELNFNALLTNNDNYNINLTTGLITLKQAVVITDVIKIRYKFEMINITDFTLNQSNGALLLVKPVTNDILYLADGYTTDEIEASYNYSSTISGRTITGEMNSFFTGILKHSLTGTIFATVVNNNIAKIININSSYINIGDSDKISRSIIGLSQAADGSLLTYDNDNQKIVRYDSNLNYVEDVYTDTTDLVATDAYDICGIVELPI